MQVIILAGGSGSRLWPLSKEACPKQFLKLYGSFSLLQYTVKRFLDHPILLITQPEYEELVHSQLKEIEAERISILLEPCRKNTAPAIALALRFLQEKGSIHANEPILVVPSDHWIEEDQEFFFCVEKALPLALAGQMILFGATPTRAEPGFGYIQKGPFTSHCCYLVERFIEKPDKEKAQELIQEESVLWNAGIFAFTFETMQKAFESHLPQLFRLFSLDWSDCLEYFFFLPPISLDYGVIERASSLVVAPLTTGWSDVGNWESLYEVLPKDHLGNVSQGKVYTEGTGQSLILSKEKPIVALGLDDVIIVDTNEALLVMKKQETKTLQHILQQYVLQ